LTINLVPFIRQHAQDIIHNGLNNGAPPAPEYWQKWVGQLQEEGLAFSGIENGNLVGSGGIIRMWPGVGEAWFLGSWRLHDNRVAAARLVRRHLKKCMQEKSINRVQVAVLDDWPTGKRFVEFLGFTHEGLMRRYFDDVDYVRYARVL